MTRFAYIFVAAMLLATPVLAQDAAPDAETAGSAGDDWQAFLDNPTPTNLAPVLADAQACDQGTACPADDDIDTDMIEDLGDLIEQGNRPAVVLALNGGALFDGNEEGASYVYESFGPLIKSDPVFFLTAVHMAGDVDTDLVTLIAEDDDSDDSTRLAELQARRASLAQVHDASLQALRDSCIQLIDEQINGMAVIA